MVRRKPRYIVSALGGLALIGSAIGGIAAARAGGSSAMASVNGSFPLTCTRQASVTDCTAPMIGPPANLPARVGNVPSYRDGTYGVVGHYETPGGSETLGVTIALKAGLVTNAAVTVEAKSPTARQFQDQFTSRYSTQVVARKLSTVEVSRVAGASLTSVGFNRAIAQIRSAAGV